MRSLLLIIAFFTQTALFGQNLPDTNYVYSEQDTINGQIETAKQLKYFIDNKHYDAAIELFSEAQQKKIKEIRKDPEKFAFWVNAWTITDEKLERYISRIRRHKGQFVFENGSWKVDEN